MTADEYSAKWTTQKKESFNLLLHLQRPPLKKGSGNPELKNRVTNYDVVKPSKVKLRNSGILVSLNKDKISELRNSEILFS